jgi:hypothetical protein
MLITLTPSVSQFSRKCMSLNISQLYGPPRPVTGLALPFNLLHDSILIIGSSSGGTVLRNISISERYDFSIENGLLSHRTEYQLYYDVALIIR